MANNDIDFATLPDAEAARLMAEMDGYYVEGPERKRWVLKDKNGHVKPSQGGYRYTADSEEKAWSYAPPYPRSLDAAVGWLARMGLELEHLGQGSMYPWLARCKNHPINRPGPIAARAVCNAGWAAVQAREAANG